MPPLPLILDAFTHAVLPAAVASVAVFGIVVAAAPSPVRVAAGALALAAGFLAGNHFRGAIEYRIDSEQSLTFGQFWRAALATVVPPSGDDEEPEPTPLAYYWLPWTGGLALCAGLFARVQERAALTRALRVAVAAVTTPLAIPPELRSDAPWIVPLFAAVVLATWLILERLVTEPTPARLRFGPALAGMVAFAGAAVVLMHAHSARLSDIAVILSVSLAATAAVGLLLGADSSSVAPGVATALPSLMVSGYYDTFSEVPSFAFALIAASLLALAPLLLPRVRMLTGRRWFLFAAALAAAPILLAISLAMRAESLSFE